MGASGKARERQLFASVSEVEQARLSRTLDKLIANLLRYESVVPVDS